jgi:cGMP-dependent protein kinase
VWRSTICGGSVRFNIFVTFLKEAEDPYEIYEEIAKKPLTYPSFLKDRKAKKLMDQILNKTPEIRVGGSYAALKAN